MPLQTTQVSYSVYKIHLVFILFLLLWVLLCELAHTDSSFAAHPCFWDAACKKSLCSRTGCSMENIAAIQRALHRRLACWNASPSQTGVFAITSASQAGFHEAGLGKVRVSSGSKM